MASMALSPSAAALFRSRHDRLSAARRIAMVLVAGLCACGPACTSARADDTAPATRPAKDPAEAMLKVDRAHLQPVDATKLAIVADPGTPRPPYAFSAEDSAFLDEVQRGCFNFLWDGGDPATGMVPDRSSIKTVSVAGVGFQLSALPVGVSHGWITPQQALERTDLILTTLTRDPSVREHGLFQHYVDGVTGKPHNDSLEHVVSTIDSALLLAGVLTISSYLHNDPAFAGNADAARVATLADTIFADADWRAFVGGDWPKPHERGFVSLGLKTRGDDEGQLIPFFWADNGCEHRLVTFLGVCAPEETRRLEPVMYYRLRRSLGVYMDGPKVSEPMVYLPFSGALFTNQFSHVWLDYAKMGPDNPGAWGMVHRPSVDWWENSRRLTKLQMKVCAASPLFEKGTWGFTASDAPGGYSVPGVYPTRLPMKGAVSEFDYSTFVPNQDFGDGTVAPYGAGCAILFYPEESIAALRRYRELADTRAPGLWNDPAKGGYGFQDAFNLHGAKANAKGDATTDGAKAWVGPDVVSIDAGPLILMIENARTGQVQNLFMTHPYVKDGLKRLKLAK